MTPLARSLLFALAATALCASCATPPSATPLAASEPRTADDPLVCTLDDELIRMSDVDRFIAQVMDTNFKNLPSEDFEEVRSEFTRDLVDNIVDQRLLTRAVRSAGIRADPADVDAMFDAWCAARVPAGSDVAAELESQLSSVAERRERIATEIGLGQLLDQRYGIEPPTDERIAAYYEAHPDEFQVPATIEARHILIEVASNADAEQHAERRAEAAALRRQIVDEGADFAQLASEHSACASRSDGGYLGRFSRGQMVPPFERVAFALAPGEVSEVVETRFGYHVIELLTSHSAEHRTLDEAHDAIARSLHLAAREEAKVDLLLTLRAEAAIEYHGLAAQPAP